MIKCTRVITRYLRLPTMQNFLTKKENLLNIYPNFQKDRLVSLDYSIVSYPIDKTLALLKLKQAGTTKRPK